MNLGYWILEQDGVLKEVDRTTWATWFEVSENRVVKQTKMKDGTLVSTIFLGIDYSFFGEKTDLPVVFETMVFDKHGGSLEQYEDRYATKKEAVKEHNRIVRELRTNHAKGT